MSKNQIYLNQIFDEVTSFINNVVTTAEPLVYTLTNNRTISHPNDLVGTPTYTVGHSNYSPYKMWEYNDTFWIDLYKYDFKPSCSIPSYPVSNYSILKDGSSLIEIAITGFEDNEISIEKVESKIIVKGKKEKKEEVKKYLYKNIACRDFELEFQGADSWDYSKIEAEIDKGILSIKIPLKEDFKPLDIPIKKKK